MSSKIESNKMILLSPYGTKVHKSWLSQLQQTSAKYDKDETFRLYDKLKYEENWNSLMEIISNIEKDGFGFTIESTPTTCDMKICDSVGDSIVINNMRDLAGNIDKKMMVWDLIIDFITYMKNTNKY